MTKIDTRNGSDAKEGHEAADAGLAWQAHAQNDE
jgi:hypothetical protein